MKYDTQKFVDAIKRAAIAAEKFSDSEDGGSCNFDSAYVRVPTMRQSQADQIAALSGINVSLRSSGWQGRRLHINVGRGQGDRNTRMAEAACKSLASDGLDAHMYYQMD